LTFRLKRRRKHFSGKEIGRQRGKKGEPKRKEAKGKYFLFDQ